MVEGRVGAGHLVGAASRDEDPLLAVLLKVPGLNPILHLQLLQMVAVQVKRLQQAMSCSNTIQRKVL